MSRPSYWPAGPNFYQAPNVRPPLQLGPGPLFPYSDWGQIHATTIWQDAGRCEAGADPYFAQLLEEGGVPTEALPYVRAGDWPPMPGSQAYHDEIRWQLDHMSPATRVALRQLPRVGENASGPLGPGLLARGLLGTIIRELQDGLASSHLGDVAIAVAGNACPAPRGRRLQTSEPSEANPCLSLRRRTRF